MSDRAATATYLVQRFGGALHPDTASLMAWINERAAEGWRLITVDDGVGYFEKQPVAARRRHDTHAE